MIEMWPGVAFPLEVTPSPGGTGFAVASEVADAVTRRVKPSWLVMRLIEGHARHPSRLTLACTVLGVGFMWLVIGLAS